MIGISIPNVLNYFSLWILFFGFLKSTENLEVENKLTAYALSFMWGNFLANFLTMKIFILYIYMKKKYYKFLFIYIFFYNL